MMNDKTNMIHYHRQNIIVLVYSLLVIRRYNLARKVIILPIIQYVKGNLSYPSSVCNTCVACKEVDNSIILASFENRNANGIL